jgi:hypothetical protein
LIDATPPLGTPRQSSRRAPRRHGGGRKPLPPTEKRSIQVAAYALPDEAAAIRQAAAASGETISDYVLTAVLRRAEQEQSQFQSHHTKSGNGEDGP